MPRIYISYRPEDNSRNKINLIRQRLMDQFGANNILESSTDPNQTSTAVQHRVRSCDILLIVVGQYWRGLVDESGHPLLYDPLDSVHVEIDAGLNTLMGVTVLILDGEPILSRGDLPDALQFLLDKQQITIADKDALKYELENLITEWQAIPTGTMAQENGIDLASFGVDFREADRTDYEQKRAQQRIEQAHIGYQFDKSRSGMLILVGLVMFGLLAGITLIARILLVGIDLSSLTGAESHTQSLVLEPIATYDVFASTVGFVQPDDYLYYVERNADERIATYVDPDDPQTVLEIDVLPEVFLQNQDRELSSSGRSRGIETAVGDDNIIFYSSDPDDNRVVAVNYLMDVYMVDADTLLLQYTYQPDYHRGRIYPEIIDYNRASNVLTFHLDEDDVWMMFVGDNQITDFEVISLNNLSGNITQIAMSANGDYLAVRTNIQVVLYSIPEFG